MAFIAYGISLSIGTSFWSEVMDVQLPATSRDEVSYEAHNIAGRVRQWLFGFIEHGPATLKLAFDHADYETLLTYLRGAPASIVINVPDEDGDSGGTVATFEAGITNVTPMTPANDVATCDVTLRPTGDIAITP